jgi:hypothetical protein
LNRKPEKIKGNPMNDIRTIRIGGIALILCGVLYPAVFIYLAVRFGYPDVLDGKAADILPALLQGGWAFRAAWAVYGLLPLLLLPAGVAAFQALRREMEGGMRLALHLSGLASFALMIGLLRWSTLHWELARFYQGADGSQRLMADAVFQGLNTYLGNYIGEFLGEGFMHGFLMLTAVAMLRSSGFPKWMAWMGIAISALSLVGIFRNVNGLAAAVQDLANIMMLFPIWLTVLGIGLVRFAGRRKRLGVLAFA